METLNANSIAEQFFGRMAEARQRVLLLDYDGTIAPFTPNRNEAHPYPMVATIVQRILRETDTRVVMISGRAAWDLRALLQFSPMPEIWGSHGMERLWPSGDYQLAPVDDKQRIALNSAANALAHLDLSSRLEFKAASVALHWRGLTPAAADLAHGLARHAWAPIAEYSGLSLLEFDGGLELRVSNCDKGNAVRAVLTEVNESSAIAYLGDDRTDEDAFRALRPQDLSVLVRHEFRDTSAQVWIKPPEELLHFLGDWLLACGGVA
jgi:trehalose 6-phosphate phosphatase